MADLGPEVWNAVGTPVGSDAFVQAASEDRLDWKRNPFVGGHSIGAGCSANPLDPLSPLLEDSPSFTIRSVRLRP